MHAEPEGGAGGGEVVLDRAQAADVGAEGVRGFEVEGGAGGGEMGKVGDAAAAERRGAEVAVGDGQEGHVVALGEVEQGEEALYLGSRCRRRGRGRRPGGRRRSGGGAAPISGRSR